MSVFAKARAALKLDETVAYNLTPKEIHELRNQLVGAADGARRQVQRLHAVPVNAYDYLLGRKPDHGVNFAFLDALLARADAVLARQPDAFCIENYAPCSLASARDELAGALAEAEPFRKVPRPEGAPT